MNHILDGITISGGEPFEQVVPLAELLGGISEHKPDWSILVYSGFRLSEISKDSEENNKCITFIDVLIDGGYQMDLSSKHPLTGSGNQKIHYLTNRGRTTKLQIDSIAHNKVNLGIASGQEHMIIGVFKPEMRRIIHESFELYTA